MRISEQKSLKIKRSHIGLLFFVLIGVLPFAAALTYATLYSFGLVGVVNTGFTTQFWVEVWQSGELLRSFGYSIAIAAASVLLSVGGAMWLTVQYQRDLNRKFMSYVIYLPLAVPGVVAAFFTFQLLSKSGFFARIGYHLGWITEVSDFPDLVNDPYAIGIVLTFVTIGLPFFLLLFLNVYQNERVDALNELAASLGATRGQTLRRVAVPLLLRRTWPLIALYFIFMLGSYEVPLILGQESPQMLSVLIVREIKQYDLSKISEGYVVAVIYTVVVALAAVALFARRKKPAHES